METMVSPQFHCFVEGAHFVRKGLYWRHIWGFYRNIYIGRSIRIHHVSSRTPFLGDSIRRFIRVLGTYYREVEKNGTKM